jgi:glycerophosphoryl diester phosphodiesterase
LKRTSLKISPPVIAHRGASAIAPENTFAAFKKAKELGLTWVELDVMLAESGEVIVMHDNELNRTTNGTGKVIARPYRYIKTLDAGSWFNPIYHDEKVPLLEEVLELLKSLKLSANIEIKSLPGYEELLSKHVMTLIEPYKISLFISSFSHIVLKLIHEENPALPLAFLMDTWNPDWETICHDIKPVAINVNHEILDHQKVKKIKGAKRLLLAYTVDDPLRAKELFSYGVDAVFSNCGEDFLNKLSR